MKNTHVIIITGDTNDGDYITSELETMIPCKEVKWNFSSPKYGNHGELTLMQIVENLKIALMLYPSKHRHNWSREEFDKRNTANHTIASFLKVSFDMDIESDEFLEKYGEDEYEEILEKYYEEFCDLFPYGEFGIHTISKIEIRPLVEVKTLFDSDSIELPMGTTLAVKFKNPDVFTGEHIVFYSRIKGYLYYLDSSTNEWIKTDYEDVDDFDTPYAEVIWNRGY